MADIEISENRIRSVEAFNYLSSVVDKNAILDEISSQLKKANSAYGKLYRLELK